MPQNKYIIPDGKGNLSLRNKLNYVVFGGGAVDLKKNRLWKFCMHILSINKLFSIFVVEVIK